MQEQREEMESSTQVEGVNVGSSGSDGTVFLFSQKRKVICWEWVEGRVKETWRVKDIQYIVCYFLNKVSSH